MMNTPRHQFRSDLLSIQIAANKRRAALLVASFVAVLTLLFSVVFTLIGLGLVGVVIAVFVACALAAIAWFRGEDVALRRTGAELADVDTHPRLHNLVEGLCVAAGLPKPEVFVRDSPGLNALAVGRDSRRAALVVTSGLLEGLTRIELEGVVAHELSHVKAHDILPGTVAVTFIALPLRPLPALAARVCRVVAGENRETLADLSGVAVTRYPPGLIAALEKIAAGPPVDASPAVAHLWLAPPHAGPTLETRIEALREL